MCKNDDTTQDMGSYINSDIWEFLLAGIDSYSFLLTLWIRGY